MKKKEINYNKLLMLEKLSQRPALMINGTSIKFMCKREVKKIMIKFDYAHNEIYLGCKVNISY